ncbi:two-component system, chemotaxis family, sensor kinase CheA [Novimethylophilus kurashikiensis]|uniref:Chemotaxis protein CheA n=1 Tax=Novimethylophilus kurashikiensis TaxID=1825523 RepID=A0A2R5F8V6_9PROT|nr:chemotaxis protein CheW [Novimethylophilus kurashikiensis]GBG14682.1 two-component system, chemotaxis family, sensor kinase CheA [Novimethylophilus kurashikiensis]
MSIDMGQFYQTFFDESAERLEEMESLLLSMDIEAPDIEELNAIFRAAHSIKGGSGTFGFTDMTEVTHVLENLLDRLRKGEMTPSEPLTDVFLEAVDVLKAQLNGHIRGEPTAPESKDAVCRKLLEFSETFDGSHSSANPEIDNDIEASEAIYRIEIQPAKFLLKQPAILETMIEELTRQGKLETLQQPVIKGKKKKTDKSTPWVFRLTTSTSAKTLQETLEFLIPPKDFSIEHVVDVTHPAPVSDDDLGFGFFDDLPLPPPDASTDESVETVTTGAPSAVEDTGFGFFEELPLVPAAEAPASRPSGKPKLPQGASKTAASSGNGDSSIRVSVERVDQLINLVGELVITQAMLAQTGAALDPVTFERLHAGLAQLERNTRDLQESVMSIRMMPISFVFSRFPRVVRDLAGKLNKQVELVTVGETTELDKGLIEKIADPLTHLVRNSLDHGIEQPDVRIDAGKPAKGTITLSASHQGGNIVIQVSDDGGGLNRDKILDKARERGLAVSEGMSDNEVWMLIFEPGFSTAEVVTDVSGRGVGMDVVKRNITEMGGSVGISSEAGQGTSITIRLPLTLAILDGMTVGLGDSLYVIPLNTIVETLQPQAQDIKTVTGEGRMVHVRGEYLPVIALHNVFNLATDITDPCDGVLVLIEAEGKKAALFVDALVGQQQVVIKSLETNFRKVVGVSGATIMGDGTVALILDVPTLIKLGQ